MHPKTISEKILQAHLIDGKLEKGSEIGIKIDDTLTQDATGTIAYLQFESIGIDRVRNELAVSYVDHNTLQDDFKNPDDHRFLRSIAERYGIYFSPPGNGICHQLHLERFAIPGKTLLGSDSHTPTGGGIGMLAIGAGGLDVACAMAGEPFYLKMPEIRKVNLSKNLMHFVSAKDVILEILRIMTVSGGFGKILEYSGDGIKNLDVPGRATITNMGTETGATTSIFPSDEITKNFMTMQNRLADWKNLNADDGAVYDERIDINLSEIEPMLALPHSPDNVKKVKDVQGINVEQVVIGSCTNSSLRDLKTVAQLLKDRKVSKNVDLIIAPGSGNVVEALIESKEYSYFIKAGARVIENVCGPCIGMGYAPPSEGVSVRTINRNFLGRSGTKDAKVYISSPETAVACAITGKISDPRDVFEQKILKRIKTDENFPIVTNFIAPLPIDVARNVQIIRGPNIKPLPKFEPQTGRMKGEILIKLIDNISTDHIMPAGAKILPLRSNIPEISKYVFNVVDDKFYQRAIEQKGGFIVAGENYGQGSSREHAAIAPRYLGIKAVIAKSFARIHTANLINFGILPLMFENKNDYDRIEQGDIIEISAGIDELRNNKVIMGNSSKNFEIGLMHDLSRKDIEIISSGGKLNFIAKKLNG
ncbi:putative Aconitate hydratase, Aquifex type [groundwater metagenome]|uniref:Putative Aconitate hydratase, Aquifex type n=1 Tax=groundwater metagenome TaxID=717931 RepID=A0A098E8I4_9ZZZZ